MIWDEAELFYLFLCRPLSPQNLRWIRIFSLAKKVWYIRRALHWLMFLFKKYWDCWSKSIQDCHLSVGQSSSLYHWLMFSFEKYRDCLTMSIQDRHFSVGQSSSLYYWLTLLFKKYCDCWSKSVQDRHLFVRQSSSRYLWHDNEH